MKVWLMKLSVKEFLDTVQNPSTRKGYRQGIKKFVEYYGKTTVGLPYLRRRGFMAFMLSTHIP